MPSSLQEIIFRLRGSVLPSIWIEVVLTLGMSIVYVTARDSNNETAIVLHDMCLRACHSRSLKTSLHVRSAVECANGNLSGFCVSPAIFPAQPVGHQIGGTLLAFLVVFRSQIALNMYLEGRSHLGAIMAGSKALAMQILAPLAFRSVFHSKMVP